MEGKPCVFNKLALYFGNSGSHCMLKTESSKKYSTLFIFANILLLVHIGSLWGPYRPIFEPSSPHMAHSACFLLVTCLVYSLTLAMGAAHSPETSVKSYQTTEHHFPEDSILQSSL
jgi:hypothetical protein